VNRQGDEDDLLHHRRHCQPSIVSRVGLSCQFGRESAPMMPQRVQTMRGPNDGTGTSSLKRSTFSTASWWHGLQ
jgi:hypothetical protein